LFSLVYSVFLINHKRPSCRCRSAKQRGWENDFWLAGGSANGDRCGGGISN